MNKEQIKQLEQMLTPQALSDLRKYQIKQTGKKVWSIPKLGVKRISNWYKNIKNKMYDYVASDELDALKSKAETQTETIDIIKQLEEENPNVAIYREVEEKAYEKTMAKQAKITGRNLGVFSLSKMALKKFSKDTVNKAIEKVQNQKELHAYNKSLKKAMKEEKKLSKESAALQSEMDFLYMAMRNNAKRGMELQQRYNDLAAQMGYNNQASYDYEDSVKKGR